MAFGAKPAVELGVAGAAVAISMLTALPASLIAAPPKVAVELAAEDAAEDAMADESSHYG